MAEFTPDIVTLVLGYEGTLDATWSGGLATTECNASENPAVIDLTGSAWGRAVHVYTVYDSQSFGILLSGTALQTIPMSANISVELSQIKATWDCWTPFVDLDDFTDIPGLIANRYVTGEIPVITASISGTVARRNSLTATLQGIEASLHAIQEIIGTINKDLRPITLGASGRRDIVGSINRTLPPIRLNITGINGLNWNMTFRCTLHPLELSAHATRDVHGFIAQELSAIGADLEIEGAIFEIVAMNLLNKAITNFTNYPFNSFAYFKGKYYGCTNDGIYELTGITDYSTNISAFYETGLLDLEIGLLKRVRHAHLGFKASGELVITITTDDGASYSYTVEHYTDNYGGQKVKFGKGFKDRYMKFKVANTEGCTFHIDRARVFDEPIRHRKR